MKGLIQDTDQVKEILNGTQRDYKQLIKKKYENTHIQWFTNKYGTRLVEMQNDVEGETYGKNPNGTTWHGILACRELPPPHRKGDVLYIREKFALDGYEGGKKFYVYWADTDDCRCLIWGTFEKGEWTPTSDYNWHSPAIMPREAARIFLRVTQDSRPEHIEAGIWEWVTEFERLERPDESA